MQKIDPTVREIDSHTVEQRDTHTHTQHRHTLKNSHHSQICCVSLEETLCESSMPRLVQTDAGEMPNASLEISTFRAKTRGEEHHVLRAAHPPGGCRRSDTPTLLQPRTLPTPFSLLDAKTRLL